MPLTHYQAKQQTELEAIESASKRLTDRLERDLVPLLKSILYGWIEEYQRRMFSFSLQHFVDYWEACIKKQRFTQVCSSMRSVSHV